jgi:hypothetical protein
MFFHLYFTMIFCYNQKLQARVVELVDTLALGASASGREGSSPFSRTSIYVKRPAYTSGRFTSKIKRVPVEKPNTPQRSHFSTSLHHRNQPPGS